MLNLNPIHFSSNLFFSLFATLTLTYTFFSKSHDFVCKSKILFVLNSKISYGHKLHCIKQLPLISNEGLLSNHSGTSPQVLKSKSSILSFFSLPTLNLWAFSFVVDVVAFAELTSCPFISTMYPFTNHNIKSLFIKVGTLYICQWNFLKSCFVSRWISGFCKLETTLGSKKLD